MDPHERFYRRSLRDVLVAQGVLTPEQAEELARAAREADEPFGGVVFDAGYLTSWDLAKTISTTYQLPILPLAKYQLEKKTLEEVPPALMHGHLLMPVGRFGRAWSFAVAEPPTRTVVEELRSICGTSVFFFATEIEELRKILRLNVKVVDVAKDSSWQSIFDTGEQAVLEDNKNQSN